jgi:hypothetical protein
LAFHDSNALASAQRANLEQTRAKIFLFFTRRHAFCDQEAHALAISIVLNL